MRTKITPRFRSIMNKSIRFGEKQKKIIIFLFTYCCTLPTVRSTLSVRETGEKNRLYSKITPQAFKMSNHASLIIKGVLIGTKR